MKHKKKWSRHSRNLPDCLSSEEFTFRNNCSSIGRRYAKVVGVGEFVKVECASETIRALVGRLERFGAVAGEPEWLVSAVWLCTPNVDYLASSSTRVLSDGYIARPLTIDRADDFVRQLRSDLPDVATRLVARHGEADLPEPARPRSPRALDQVPGPPLSSFVVIRVAARASIQHRIACGLLFDFEARRLLVGTDVETLAMVLSEDDTLIDRYLEGCELLAGMDYLARYGC
ncbi:MAG: hypothetical protein ACJ8F4_02655 [Sphingomonas sp.]